MSDLISLTITFIRLFFGCKKPDTRSAKLTFLGMCERARKSARKKRINHLDNSVECHHLQYNARNATGLQSNPQSPSFWWSESRGHEAAMEVIEAAAAAEAEAIF